MGILAPTTRVRSPTQGFCGFRAPDERGQRPPDPDFRRGLADRLQRPVHRQGRPLDVGCRVRGQLGARGRVDLRRGQRPARRGEVLQRRGPVVGRFGGPAVE